MIVEEPGWWQWRPGKSSDAEHRLSAGPQGPPKGMSEQGVIPSYWKDEVAVNQYRKGGQEDRFGRSGVEVSHKRKNGNRRDAESTVLTSTHFSAACLRMGQSTSLVNTTGLQLFRLCLAGITQKHFLSPQFSQCNGKKCKFTQIEESINKSIWGPPHKCSPIPCAPNHLSYHSKRSA